MRHRPQHAAPAAHPVRRALARIAAAVGFVLVVFALIGALTLYARHCLRQRGLGAVDAPVLAATPAWGDEFARTGRFEAHIAFTDFAVPDDGETTMAVTWDDAWFDADRTVYNPELAAAGAVIATLAYAESGYYQAGNTCLPYMELGLSALGFTDVSTASYRYRSEVIDEALSLVTQEADGAAYGIAEKRLVGADGTLRDLMVVSVRGSYGSEWLSNLAVDSDDDHPGYREAAAEVARALAPRVKRAHQEGRSVELLLVGHSRGGAIANLVAAGALDELAGLEGTRALIGLAAGDGVRAYTYASPATTVSSDAADARYASIFNIANPADIMTHLPFEAWGYVRYGVDVALPSVTSADFATRHAAMEETFAEVMGAPSPYNPEDELLIADLTADISGAVRSLDDLMTPAGVATVVSTVAMRVNPWEILYAHYPSVYIAWLESLAA